jgi:hypothetical protein
MDEQETAFVQDLIAGKGFHQFIVASTVSLIVSSLEITDNTVPETLLLDTHRITMFRGEIDNLVAMATVLVSAAQNIGMPSPAKRLVSFFACLELQPIVLIPKPTGALRALHRRFRTAWQAL